MSEITKRIVTALITAPVFLYLIWLGGVFFSGIILVLSVVIQLEIAGMISKRGGSVNRMMAVLLGVPVLFLVIWPTRMWLLFLFFFIMTLLAETFRRQESVWERLMATLMVAMFSPALLSSLFLIRRFGDEYTGFVLTLTLFLLIWANDVFAYFGGKTLGRNPLAPVISPSKTVEGFISGFLASIVFVLISHAFIPDFPLSLSVSVGFAVVCGLFGPIGDLTESRLKRSCNIKDSSDLMPGHGGMFDRFDAVMMAAPAIALYLHALVFFNLI